MMSVRRFTLFNLVASVVCAIGLSGCGGEPTTKPKLDLSDDEKRQIQELNEQRQKEWSGTPAPQ
jgi:hypothetical protein